MREQDDLLIERAIRGELSPEEEQSFQERLSSDDAFRDKVTFEKQLFETLGDSGWNTAENTSHPEVRAYTEAFQGEEAEMVKHSIEQASRNFTGKKAKIGPRSVKLWMFASAAVIAFVLTFVFLRSESATQEELYISYLQKTELPNLNTRSNESESEQLRAQGLFDNQEYDAAAAVFQSLIDQSNAPSAVYINLALCQIELAEYSDAIVTLDLLITSNLLDAPKGHWFKALVHLKAADKTKARSGLQTIIENRYYNYQLAEELLSELPE